MDFMAISGALTQQLKKNTVKMLRLIQHGNLQTNKRNLN